MMILKKRKNLITRKLQIKENFYRCEIFDHEIQE